jgi:hypothetical protein
VAALSFDAARAAREEAERLRVDSWTLRFAVQQSLCLATANKERAETEAATAARRRHAVPSAASPWSRLPWLREDHALDRVLVPVD